MKRQASADSAQALVSRMARALDSDPRYVVAEHSEPGAGLARVGLRSSGSGDRVAWNADRTRCLVMEGELYDLDSLSRAFSSEADRAFTGNQAEVLLRLYERCGSKGMLKVHGAFVAAIWDTQARQVTLLNDRLGLFPFYYARVNGNLLFASGVRALMAEPELDRTVDLIALNQFLVFDHALNQRTLLDQVHLLPPASVLTFSEGQFAVRPYWTLRYPEVYESPQREEAYVEQLTHYLRQAVRRQKPDGRPAAMLLSGGLDSRLLLGLLREDGANLETFTFGIPGCEDARVSANVAKVLGTRHRFLELKSDWLTEFAEEGVRRTDGLANIVNLHVMATGEAQSQHAEVIYKGFLGDALLGFALKPEMWGNYAPQTRYQVQQGVHRQQGVLNYEASEQKLLLTDAFLARVGDAVFQEYCDGMDRSGSTQLANQRLYFDLTQRVPRMTLNGVDVARRWAVVRLPFGDYDLLDFALTVPPGFLFERRLQKAALVKFFPRLAQIPIAGTGRPLAACARDVWIQSRNLASWHLRQRGYGFLAARERRPYKDYDRWFRTILRPWVEDILLNPRTLDRGYFRPDYVKQLVAAHMAGTNHSVRLGALVTVELWHRQFVD